MRGLPGLTLDPDVEAFRADVRGFLADALAPGRAARGTTAPTSPAGTRRSSARCVRGGRATPDSSV